MIKVQFMGTLVEMTLEDFKKSGVLTLTSNGETMTLVSGYGGPAMAPTTSESFTADKFYKFSFEYNATRFERKIHFIKMIRDHLRNPMIIGLHECKDLVEGMRTIYLRGNWETSILRKAIFEFGECPNYKISVVDAWDVESNPFELL